MYTQHIKNTLINLHVAYVIYIRKKNRKSSFVKYFLN